MNTRFAERSRTRVRAPSVSQQRVEPEMDEFRSSMRNRLDRTSVAQSLDDPV
jgi:hypothetical protein